MNEENQKDTFYQELVEVTTHKYLLMFSDDFNTKIGKKSRLNQPLEDIFLMTCAMILRKYWVIDHKNIHKQTWGVNDGKMRHEIDYVLINARHGRNVMNVRSLREEMPTVTISWYAQKSEYGNIISIHKKGE